MVSTSKSISKKTDLVVTATTIASATNTNYKLFAQLEQRSLVSRAYIPDPSRARPHSTKLALAIKRETSTQLRAAATPVYTNLRYR